MEKPEQLEVSNSEPSNFLDPSSETTDVFGNETNHDIKYKTIGWQLAALLWISEIVGVAPTSLPNSLAAVGLFPGVFLIIFLGLLATYTAKVLIDFKLNHPEMHSMGDAGMIMWGPIGREVLTFGAIAFAVTGTGSAIIGGQQALSTLSNNGLCAVRFALIFSAIAFVISLSRTLARYNWLSILATSCILLATFIAMIGAGISPVEGRVIKAVQPQSFLLAFVALSNPVFGYAGHFMMPATISEMRKPQDAMKAVWTLQIFAITLYTVFAVVSYVYLGDQVLSPSYASLSPVWQKAVWAIELPGLIIICGFYVHITAKLLFVRVFRNSELLHSNSILAWGSWVALCFLCITLSFLFVVGVPIFNYLIGICASLFASWYTYGLAGFLWLYDARHHGKGWRAQPGMAILSVMIILVGAFLCVAGMYVFITLIIEAYASGAVPKPFTC